MPPFNLNYENHCECCKLKYTTSTATATNDYKWTRKQCETKILYIAEKLANASWFERGNLRRRLKHWTDKLTRYKKLKEEENLDYERNYSHFHCWDQVNNEDSDIEKNNFPACGQPLRNHTQCCLCDLKVPKAEEKEFREEMVEKIKTLLEKQKYPEPLDSMKREYNCGIKDAQSSIISLLSK